MSEQPTLNLMISVDTPLVLPDFETSILPAFNPDTACPKCRCESVSTNYHVGIGTHRPCGSLLNRLDYQQVQDFGEHLDRTCGRCHYGWAEACADATNETPEQNGD